MRIFALMLAACAALTLDWSAAHAAVPASQAETRLGHISVVKSGTGPAIVLIPGLSTPREVWSKFVPELVKSHTVYSVQVNGFAGDAPAPTDALLANAVGELHSLLERDKAGPAKIVGHSMGGLMAMMLATEHPSDVSAVMIVDAFPFAGVMFDEKATAESVRPMAAMLRTRMEGGYSGPHGEASAAATADGLTAKAESAEQVKAWILKADPKVAAAAMAEDLVLDLRGRLGVLSVPVTVVHPAEAMGRDAAATAAFYRAQYAGAPNIRFETVADSAHFVMLDQPEKFGAILHAFAE